MPLLCDTGALYALADRRDAWHARVREHLEAHPDTLVVPVTILAEVAYLLRERIGVKAELAFARSIAGGEFALEKVEARDCRRVVELLVKYPWLGFVDATVITVAERLKVTSIATTDHRHFGSVQPAHARGFTLVP